MKVEEGRKEGKKAGGKERKEGGGKEEVGGRKEGRKG